MSENSAQTIKPKTSKAKKVHFEKEKDIDGIVLQSADLKDQVVIKMVFFKDSSDGQKLNDSNVSEPIVLSEKELQLSHIL